MMRLRWLGLGLWTLGAAAGCSGSDGGTEPTVLDVQPEVAGEHCAAGGVKLVSGVDADGDGVLQDAEVSGVEYVCDASAALTDGDPPAGGGDGDGAVAGGEPLVDVMQLSMGDATCPGGGVLVLSGFDADGDGMLDADEVSASAPICGARPTDGAIGGRLIDTATVDPGHAVCAQGGIAIYRGLDSNANGTLDTGEIEETSYACNGEAGLASPEACSTPTRWDADLGRCVATGDWTDQNLDGLDAGHSYLAGLDFTGSTLVGADLAWTELKGADFTGADLMGADLGYAGVDGTDFTDAVLDGANLEGVDLRDAASLEGLHATGLVACPRRLPDGWECIELGDAGLTLVGPGADLVGLDLGGADLGDVNLDGTQLTGLVDCPAVLPQDWYCLELGPAGWTLVGPEANLSGLDMTGADFRPADNLRDVDFDGAILVDAIFADGTDFRGASFDGADLSDADFGDGADLRDVRFLQTNLGGVDLGGADLDGVRGTELAECPDALPADWACLDLPQTGNTLVGPGANLRGLDLAGADLAGVDLRDADLRDTNLEGADLRGAALDGAQLDDAILVDAMLDGADLAGADLQDADLAGASLDGADLQNADLQDANLAGASLVGADLGNADLGGANLDGVTAYDLQGCPDSRPDGWFCIVDGTGDGTRVLLGPGAALGGVGLNLSDRDLAGRNLVGADLAGANLSGANMQGVDLQDADLAGADLSGADLQDANLQDANLQDADLQGADLSGADLSGADLSGADLSNADLSGADLSGADLTGADLSDADLSGADLSDADLTGATITGTLFNDTTCPNGTNSNDNGNTCF